MFNYQKAPVISERIIDKINSEGLSKVKINDVIKVNLGIAYFIVLSFLIIKLLFT